MIKKISFICLVILFLTSCGYKPIYSKKSQNFSINSIETVGEIKVNKLLNNKLKIYKNNPDSENSFNIIINSKSLKTTITKDKKGNPTQFSLNLSITIKIIDSQDTEIEKVFSETSTYDNSTNKFDLRKYEDNLLKNMTESIFSEMILFIQTRN